MRKVLSIYAVAALFSLGLVGQTAAQETDKDKKAVEAKGADKCDAAATKEES